MTTRTLIVHSNELKAAEKLTLKLHGEIETKKNHFRIYVFNKACDPKNLKNMFIELRLVDTKLQHFVSDNLSQRFLQ